MDESTARDYLARGLAKIEAGRLGWKKRKDYYEGRHVLPYAPEGVSQEYLELREMALANWLPLAMDTPIQRLRADGFRTGRSKAADETTWNEVWQPNRLDSRQRIVYTQMVVHGRGLMSVWPNARNRRQPIIRPENGERVHIEPDPEDPFTAKWAVKVITVDDYPGVSSGALWVPGTPGQRSVGFVYDADTWARFERGGNTFSSDWVLVAGGTHPLGDVPFVAFDNRQDSDAKPQSGIEPLIPAQDSINMIRFNILLALQFSAFRQRVFTGYDPVVKDGSGNPVWKMADDGVTPLLDGQGLPIPQLRSPGRIGVDRALVFPGEATKVFDLPESNLSNYITVLSEFLTDLFAVAQVPPQYLLNRMANLSGDALAGAESTLQSLVSDLQRWCGEALEEVMRRANRARGTDEPDLASEVVWADAEARSFAQTIDGIVKLVSVDFPKRAAFEMIPNATPPKVERWMKLMDEEQKKAAANDPIAAAANAFRIPPPPGDGTQADVAPQPDPAGAG